MKTDQANQLLQIYNTLMTINAHGRDCVILGRCLEALENLLPQIKIEPDEDKKEE